MYAVLKQYRDGQAVWLRLLVSPIETCFVPFAEGRDKFYSMKINFLKFGNLFHGEFNHGVTYYHLWNSIQKNVERIFVLRGNDESYVCVCCYYRCVLCICNSINVDLITCNACYNGNDKCHHIKTIQNTEVSVYD